MIETAKRTLFEGNAVAASDVPFRRRKGQFKNKHNVEDILFVLHKHPAGLPAFAVCDLSSLAASAGHQECRLRSPIRRDARHQSGDGEFARDCREAKQERGALFTGTTHRFAEAAPVATYW